MLRNLAALAGHACIQIAQCDSLSSQRSSCL